MDPSRERMMKPIAPLMIEHRLIERMIRLVDRERERVAGQGRPDPAFIDTAVDFIRTYADRCHHGKEEDIYFKDLAAREISEEHRRLVNELIEEHKYARGVVAALVGAKERYVAGDSAASAEIEQRLRELVEFYPVHIQKEDRQLFIPSMAYYTANEQAAMLQQMWDFDRKLIHEKYRGVVEGLEGRGLHS
jgi:hemerythrin-like domain-containing protein